MDPSEEKTQEGAKNATGRKEEELEELEKRVLEMCSKRKPAELSGVGTSLPKLHDNISATSVDGQKAYTAASKKPVPSFAYAPTPENIILKANYFLVLMKDNYDLYQYFISITPDVDRMDKRKAIVKYLRSKVRQLAYIFDGTTLITPSLLVKQGEELRSYTIMEEKEKQEYTITVTLVKKASRYEAVYNQVYNLILRKCMFALDLDEIGRNFYDRNNPIDIPNHRIQLWPGYVTSMHQYDNDVLLCVEIIHRVLRVDNILNIMNGMRKFRNFRDIASNDLKNSIVMTHYNKKTYKVDDIDWNSNPTSCFDMKGESVSYVSYYKKVYGLDITDFSQPLLICRPTKKDFRRNEDPLVIMLVPELCQITGLSDSMRADMNLMKALAVHLHMSPANRAQEAENFILRFITNENVRQYLNEWHLDVNPELIRCPYNILKKESIVFADGEVATNAQVDWTSAFRSRKMLKVMELKNWIIIVPTKDMDGVGNLVRTAVKVATTLNFKIHPPKIVEIEDSKIPSYMNALRAISLPIDLVFFIIPMKSAEPYATIKRFLTVDLGVPSQGFTSKNLHSKGIMSIVTKVVVQMNAKLGGEPWGVRIPLKDIMVVGIDIQKCGGGYIGSLTASNSPSLRSYYSHTTRYSSGTEFSTGIVTGVKGAIDNFFGKNAVYPERIIIFRDSASEGMENVLEKEAKALMGTFTDFYTGKNIKPPKFAYVAFFRKSGTRLFAENINTEKMNNPEPGTVVQDKITAPPYPTFFLIAPTARQGCVSPCCYKVIYDTTKLTSDKMQILVYKLCHLYYNWSGTVGVPTPGHYARKLGFVAANVLKGDTPSKRLENSLHFL